MQRFLMGAHRLLIVAVLALAAAAWAGSAVAVPPERTVLFDDTFQTHSPFCGDAIIVEHDVGRITYVAFFDQNGFVPRSAVHGAAVTSTYTNTSTGATLTVFHSNLDSSRISFDPATGIYTVTESFTGLNFILRRPGEPPLVSAGRAVDTFTVSFDSEGNPTFTELGDSATPNMVHITQILCG
jgi:hypothetical protein